MITVKAATNWKGEPGWRWACDICPRSAGFHHYFANSEKLGYSGVHPWVRCLTAANLHYSRVHQVTVRGQDQWDNSIVVYGDEYD